MVKVKQIFMCFVKIHRLGQQQKSILLDVSVKNKIKKQNKMPMPVPRLSE